MKAIRVILGSNQVFEIVTVVDQLNSHDEIAAMQCGPDMFFVGAEGECSMAYAKAIINRELEDYTIEYIK